MFECLQTPAAPAFHAPAAPGGLRAEATCEECLGSGGWFRYDPRLESVPGVLYLSCLECRGSGRRVLPHG